MKRRVVEWSVEEIYKKRNQITFPDYQREPHLWSKKDKALLIDSIIKDIDIPKMYFFESETNEYEVIDGQQRLWAIWSFLDNEFEYEIRRKEYRKFENLNKNLQDKILSYELQITIIDEVKEDYLRTLFLRLQLGLLLNTGEKLHALSGQMRDFVFNKIINNSFIKIIRIPERRFAKETLCAQICINSFNKARIDKFSRTRFQDLEYFFNDYLRPEGSDLTFFQSRCNDIKKNLDFLNESFKEKAKKLRNRSFILSIYLFVEDMINSEDLQYVKEIMPCFVDFTLLFLKRLKEETRAGFNRKNEELYKFESYLSNAPGERYQIERRHQKLREFFSYYKHKKKIKGDK